MYKLLLCIKYLKSRIIAYFAVLAVALCVAMMLIVVSVMNGFLDKIESAAKGLFGDITVSTNSGGLGRYDEFIAEVERKVPEVEASSPFLITGGILGIPGQEYQALVQVAGIRLPERADVSDFEKGLYFQAGVDRPSFDPPIGLLEDGLDKHNRELEKIYNREEASDRAHTSALTKRLLHRLSEAWGLQIQADATLRRAARYQKDLADIQARLDAAEAAAHGDYTPQIAALDAEKEKVVDESGIQPPGNRVILGLGIQGLTIRTDEGETVRYIVPGHQVNLSIVPLGSRLSSMDVPVRTIPLTVVDDCRTDVSSIDSSIVYVPFDTLQAVDNMGAQYSADAPSVMLVPPRCNQIHIKVRNGLGRGEKLDEVRGKIAAVWNDFEERYPDAIPPGADVAIETWRQRQAPVIGPIQQQRTLVVIMFGIISLVSVVLIFVIFYTIVVQKTRDIGVLKAVGASSAGVAHIFLAWGAAVGLVGSVLGCIGGYYFVRYINPIQDAMDAWFGFRVWSKEWFLFEKIPNTVDPTTAGMIALGAIVAGLIGAAVPAMRAARMQPVEALRYE